MEKLKSEDRYRPDLAQRRTIDRLPTQYDPTLHPLAVEYMLHAGMGMMEICKRLGIQRETLNRWRHDYPALNDAIKNGRKPVDESVVNALYRNALGGSILIDEEWGRVPPTSAEVLAATKAGKPMPPTKWAKIKEHRRTKPADTLAQIFWTKNRMPEQWRDRKEQQITSRIEYTIQAPQIAGSTIVPSDSKPVMAIADAHGQDVAMQNVAMQDVAMQNVAMQNVAMQDVAMKADAVGSTTVTVDITRGGLTEVMRRVEQDDGEQE